MIINSLYKHYQTLLNDPGSGISRPGFSRAKVTDCLVVSGDGKLVGVIDLRVERNKKHVSREMNVPEQVKRSSGVAANFMCDNCSYVLGLRQRNKPDKPDRIRQCYTAFVSLHKSILTGLNDEGAQALIKFLSSWDTDKAANHPVISRHLEQLAEGGSLVFRLEGAEGYLHEREPIMKAWSEYQYSQASEVKAQCLVTGRLTGISKLHANIKGVTGAQSSGAALVSFNQDSFTSYGKEQSFNAPVGEEACFGYTTALNHLLNSRRHRIRIGDTTTVFWAEKSTSGREEDLLQALFYPIFEETAEDEEEKTEQPKQDESTMTVRDPQTTQLLQDILQRVKAGKPVAEGLTGVNKDTNFYILGLAPNAARLAVRYWHVDRYDQFVEKVCRHHSDLAIIKAYPQQPDFITIGSILRETAPLKDQKRIAPLLGGVLMRSILLGTPYPMALYNAIISRIRADQEVNYTRAAVIKACLLRDRRFYQPESEVELTVALNEKNHKTGYMLGRLFALLEKAQQDASPGINATIRDRYFGAASATPGSVFPILMRLAQHHISKAEYGRKTDKRIEEVIAGIERFPAHLSLEEQGEFVLGYYQQRQALYTKKEEKESDK
ncbi:MAG: type I-C CRISPR-associated protein Cas8c/Csd1 [Firmicutes bacterium]|nr:type I-C CRISPR-associated protein Cas8c/Csd1 [Bacillota bacterium]